MRIGGHTSCVAVARDGQPPHLLLDAGTGIRRVPSLLGVAPFRGTVLLTHLHWDPVQGIPFFTAGDRDDARVVLAMPAQGDPVEVLAGAMSPPHFPITPHGLHGDWSFLALQPGRHEVEGFEALAADLPHKGGRTFGYRVAGGGRSLAYLPDHGPRGCGDGPDGLGARHEAALALARDVDVLVHGAQFTSAERTRAADYGHATVEYAAELAEEAGARRLVLFHHAPARTDDAVDAIVASMACRLPVAGPGGGGGRGCDARDLRPHSVCSTSAGRRGVGALGAVLALPRRRRFPPSMSTTPVRTVGA